MSRSLIAVALLLLAPLATAQQIYKWTDASGTVHYSQSAPAQGTKYQQVKLAGGVESADADAPAQQPAADNASTQADTPPPAPSAPMADTPDNRAKLCATLKSNLTTLQGSGPVVMQQGGKPAVLDDAQRKQQVDTANAQYQQYCAGK
ncbi:MULTISPECIES: DUF4124 domain-containing protein [Rhodanobacter]|uniref:DUF4124 domain-containing protein n=1 Tax=Rhodanobacter hydrolyticus TaxID=2250595 RepID=A0ABW8J9K0_9GAMM|nr:DUF4124 domain-containing protein [Rhodanobacter sp. 7MK24]MBD8880569.1 DUF4124 domain-containing protein [Rhodanobacter sp. 7MK24]